jgi:hypothetical protein
MFFLFLDDQYEEIAFAPQKQEAKVAAFTRMAIKLFLAGVIDAYSPLLTEEKECVVLVWPATHFGNLYSSRY